MRRSHRVVWAVAACIVLGGPRALDAQQSIRLRYTPTVGQWVQTLWWFDVTSTISEGTSGEDGLTIESAGIRSLSHRVIEVQGDRRVLEITRDSMRLRTRPVNGVWVVLADTGSSQRVRLTLDDRMRVLDVQLLTEGTAGHTQLEMFRAFSTGLEFALPEQPVGVGQTWASDVVLPFDDPTGIEEEPGVSTWLRRVGEMVARSTFTLDSLVDRGADTLAFLRVQGTFLPTTIASAAEAAEGRARISGAFGGRMIWSTGWNAFVSGALRTQVHMATFVGTPQDEAPGLSVSVDVSSRFQVR